VNFYRPTPRGLEGKIGEKLAHLRSLDAAAGAQREATTAKDAKDAKDAKES
jgi:hypothetical protein